MPRKGSPETELRHAKRRLKAFEALRDAGQLMSNLCFNLSQDKAIEERHRETMQECYIKWDYLRLKTYE